MERRTLWSFNMTVQSCLMFLCFLISAWTSLTPDIHTAFSHTTDIQVSAQMFTPQKTYLNLFISVTYPCFVFLRVFINTKYFNVFLFLYGRHFLLEYLWGWYFVTAVCLTPRFMSGTVGGQNVYICWINKWKTSQEAGNTDVTKI